MNLDFNKIRDYPITELASKLGITLSEKNDQMVGPCPISGLMNATAFKITPARNRFICFCAECKKFDKPGGDGIELVRRLRRVANPREAAAEIEKLFSGAGKAADNPSTKQEASSPAKPSGFDPLTYQAKLVPDHPALKGLKAFSAETLKDFGGGYCSKGVHAGRLALPVHGATGDIEGFLSIPVVEPFTDPVRYFKDYTPPLLFNQHRVSEPLILRSSIMEVLSSWEGGLEDAVCPLHPVTPDFLEKLASLMRQKEIETVEFY